MKHRVALTVCLISLFIIPSIATAADNAVGVKASTLGAGIEYEKQINYNLGMRFGFNYFQFDSDFNVDDINYDSTIDLQSLSAILDWYPFASAFRISGGLMLNGNDGDFTATPDRPVIIGDTLYSAQMVGTLNGSISFNTLAPYLGIGWSGGRDLIEGLSLAFDVGVLFQGSPTIEDFQATGSLAGNSAFQSNLAWEKEKIQDDLDPYKYYPVIALTLMYRF